MAVKNKTVYKIKWKNLGIVLSIVVAIVIASYGLIKGFGLIQDFFETKNLIEKLNEEIEVKSIVDDEKTKSIKPDSTLSKFDAYWDYIKLGLIEVDMAKLKRINTDAIGYMEVKGTTFSYPLVQGEKDYYKTHSFDKKENAFGWLYVDSEANIGELGTNTIVYGNKTYLGILSSALNEVFEDEWKSDDDNYLIRLYTNDHSTLWQIISVYKTKDDDHLKTSFEDEKDIEAYIESMLKNTEIKFKGYAKPDDKLLTLTTNSKGTNIVIQAKLIKIRTE